MSKQLVAYNVVSPLHLINFLAYWFAQKDNYERVVVFVNFYWGYNIIPDKYLDFCKENNIEVYYNEEKNRDAVIFERTAIMTDMVFVSHIAIGVFIKYYRRIHKVVLIDEGLSTYAGFKNIRNATKREKNKANNKGNDEFFLPYAIKNTVKNSIENIFYKKNTINFLAFSKKTGKMKNEYRKAFLQLLSFMYPNRIESNNEKVILFCSDPYVDLKVMTEQEYFLYIKNIQEKVHQKGYTLLIKKHPAEKKFDYKKYNLSVLDYEGIFEDYVFLHPIKGMIADCSTSSMLVPALYGIESFITDSAKLNDLSKEAKLIFSNYTRSLDLL